MVMEGGMSLEGGEAEEGGGVLGGLEGEMGWVFAADLGDGLQGGGDEGGLVALAAHGLGGEEGAVCFD